MPTPDDAQPADTTPPPSESRKQQILASIRTRAMSGNTASITPVEPLDAQRQRAIINDQPRQSFLQGKGYSVVCKNCRRKPPSAKPSDAILVKKH